MRPNAFSLFLDVTSELKAPSGSKGTNTDTDAAEIDTVCRIDSMRTVCLAIREDVGKVAKTENIRETVTGALVLERKHVRI